MELSRKLLTKPCVRPSAPLCRVASPPRFSNFQLAYVYEVVWIPPLTTIRAGEFTQAWHNWDNLRLLLDLHWTSLEYHLPSSLVVEVVEVARDEDVDVAHDLQHVEALGRNSIHLKIFTKQLTNPKFENETSTNYWFIELFSVIFWELFVNILVNFFVKILDRILKCIESRPCSRVWEGSRSSWQLRIRPWKCSRTSACVKTVSRSYNDTIFVNWTESRQFFELCKYKLFNTWNALICGEEYFFHLFGFRYNVAAIQSSDNENTPRTII